jgi:hypothetical protein
VKSRVLYPEEMWRNDQFQELDVQSRYLAMYLINNPHIGLTPAYRISDREIIFETGLTAAQLKASRLKVQAVGIYFLEGHCCLRNSFGYFDYCGGKTESAKKREFESLPESVKIYLAEGVIGQSLPNSSPTVERINQKLEIINDKLEIKETKKTFVRPEDVDDEECRKIAQEYRLEESVVKSKRDDMIIYCQSRKTKYTNHKLVLMGWLRDDLYKGKVHKLSVQNFVLPIEETACLASPESREKVREMVGNLANRFSMPK